MATYTQQDLATAKKWNEVTRNGVYYSWELAGNFPNPIEIETWARQDGSGSTMGWLAPETGQKMLDTRQMSATRRWIEILINPNRMVTSNPFFDGVLERIARNREKRRAQKQ